MEPEISPLKGHYMLDNKSAQEEPSYFKLSRQL
jgi:hypothetical protein